VFRCCIPSISDNKRRSPERDHGRDRATGEEKRSPYSIKSDSGGKCGVMEDKQVREPEALKQFYDLAESLGMIVLDVHIIPDETTGDYVMNLQLYSTKGEINK
jgi:hypothetical protein